MLPWVTRGGQLTAHTRGVVFGMHIMGSPVQDTTDRMGMTPKGVRHSISISERIVNGVRDEAIPSAPTTPSPKKEIAQRRREFLICRSGDSKVVEHHAKDLRRSDTIVQNDPPAKRAFPY